MGAPLHRRKVLHRHSQHQNQAIAQKLGILREKITSMTGLKFWANIKYEEDPRYLRLWSALRLWSSAPSGIHGFS